jgi:hypothetical protein
MPATGFLKRQLDLPSRQGLIPDRIPQPFHFGLKHLDFLHGIVRVDLAHCLNPLHGFSEDSVAADTRQRPKAKAPC